MNKRGVLDLLNEVIALRAQGCLLRRGQTGVSNQAKRLPVPLLCTFVSRKHAASDCAIRTLGSKVDAVNRASRVIDNCGSLKRGIAALVANIRSCNSRKRVNVIGQQHRLGLFLKRLVVLRNIELGSNVSGGIANVVQLIPCGVLRNSQVKRFLDSLSRICVVIPKNQQRNSWAQCLAEVRRQPGVLDGVGCDRYGYAKVVFGNANPTCAASEKTVRFGNQRGHVQNRDWRGLVEQQGVNLEAATKGSRHVSVL